MRNYFLLFSRSAFCFALFSLSEIELLGSPMINPRQAGDPQLQWKGSILLSRNVA